MINIDLTTKNTVYNTLGPQAQWIQHRFGRRNYPDLTLKKEHVLDVIKNTNAKINFISVFGDPSCHVDIVRILKEIEVGRVIFSSNLNFDNDELINVLNEKESYIVVPLYGINNLCNKIALHSDWDLILDNLKKLNNKACVEFYLFHHNYHQLEEIKSLSEKFKFKLEIKSGIAIHPEGFSSIVNEEGHWLYDAYSCDLNVEKIRWSVLHQTSLGYNHLIQYVKPKLGTSILNKPNFYKATEKFQYDKNVSISVTGHIFPSFTLHQIFSNALCDDWNFSLSQILADETKSIRADYVFLCSALLKIISIKNNNLNDYEYLNILTDLANSDI